MTLRVSLDWPVGISEPSARAGAESFYFAVVEEILRLGLEASIRWNDGPSFVGDPPAGLPGELRIAYHAHACGPNCWSVKASAIPGLWHMEPQGYSGWSYLATDVKVQESSAQFDLARARAIIHGWRTRFQTTNLSKYPQSDDLPAPDPGFLFYPLQVNSDRVLTLLGLSQIEILDRMSALATDPGRRLVLKRHPKCESAAVAAAIERCTKNPWVTISDASVHRLVPASRAVLVANSGVGLEALIHGKPVFAMAASEYRHMATAIDPKTGLESVFTDVPPQSQRELRQLGWFLEEELLSTTRPEQISRRLQQALASCTLGDGAVREPPLRPGALSERARRHLDEQIALALDAPSSDEGERFLLGCLRMGEQVDLITRRASARILGRAAAMYFKQKRFDLAEAAVESALHKKPDEPVALLTLARLRFARKRDEEGMDILERAASGDQASAAAHLLYARRLRLRPEAEPDIIRFHVARAVMLEPKGVSTLSWAARVLDGLGDHARAAELVCLAEATDPKHRDVLQAAAALLASEQKRAALSSLPGGVV